MGTEGRARELTGDAGLTGAHVNVAPLLGAIRGAFGGVSVRGARTREEEQQQQQQQQQQGRERGRHGIALEMRCCPSRVRDAQRDGVG
jgi:hypothetical protein